MFPVLKNFGCFCGQVTNIDSEWESFYMGFGNYLVVRKQYYDEIMKYINENFPERFKRAYIYQNWDEIITKIVK